MKSESNNISSPFWTISLNAESQRQCQLFNAKQIKFRGRQAKKENRSFYWQLDKLPAISFF
jgi:hypothetical protein